MRIHIPAAIIVAALLAGCGSSGGTSQPPAPPAPVTPPPPPEPTFEERLADWAAMDPNPCRARTPGFEALGGWLKDDGRELGESRTWVTDFGELTDSSTHGARVWMTFTSCAARSTEDQYFTRDYPGYYAARRAAGGDSIWSESLAPTYSDDSLPEPGVWTEYPALPPPGATGRLDISHDGNHDGQRVLLIRAAGNDNGKRTSQLQNAGIQLALREWEAALVMIVGGYVGEDDDRAPARDRAVVGGGLTGSSLCDEAAALCLFAPWQTEGGRVGTSNATPQVSAALDTVWAVWPDMDVLDLRNLAFDCAENMPAGDGESNTTRSYSYKNGRSFTSDTNSTWGHGILSLTCLFTPNGGLQNPVTGNPISGGIYGPVAGPVTGATITGFDYTGRGFGYGFAYPVFRENHAMAAAANLRPVQAISGFRSSAYGPGAFRGRLAETGRLRVDLTASGNAIGAAGAWRVGGFTFQGGIAAQPEGVGSLTGSRAFRAPATVSGTVTTAYAKALRHGFSAHLQADHWRTLATQDRSLWEGAEIRESRLSLALVKRAGRHEFALKGVWRSGLSGSLDVDGRNWALSPRAESGVWLTWRRVPAR